MVVLQPREDSGSVFSTTNNQEAEEGNHTPPDFSFPGWTNPALPTSVTGSAALLYGTLTQHNIKSNAAHGEQGKWSGQPGSVWMNLWVSFTSDYFKSLSPLSSFHWGCSTICRVLTPSFCCPATLQSKQWWKQFTQKLRNYLHDVKMEIKINLLKDLTIFFLEWLQNPELGWHVKNSETALSCTIPKLNIAVKQVILLARLRKQGEQQLCVWQTKYL